MMLRGAVSALLLTQSLLVKAAVEVDEIKHYSTYEPEGLQSGPDSFGSTFVSSVAYSKADNSVILTGSTWGRFFESREQLVDEDFDQYGEEIADPRILNGCFMAVAALPGSTHHAAQGTAAAASDKNLFWSRKQRVHAPSANEACNAVHYFDDTESVMVAGHTEERRNTTVSATEVVEEVQQFGLFLDLDWNMLGDKSFKTVGGQLLKDESVIYPVALTSRSTKEEDGLFVVFMEANHDAQHIDLKEGEQPRDPFAYFDYGAGYGMSVARYDTRSTQVTAHTKAKRIEQTWLFSYDTSDANGEVYISDIIQASAGLLIVVGSTNGYGPAYGAEQDKGKDMDGFISKINPSTGQLVVEPGFPSAQRISSITNHASEWITGVCNDDTDADHIYVTGMTDGILSGSNASVKGTSAFIMKLSVRTLQPIWTKQLGSHKAGLAGNRVARGMACAISPKENSLWFGGIVESGGVILESGQTQSFGGKDIFVAKLDIETGAISMVKQMGSSEDDELALRGGLVCDADGNAVVIGNTYGSFYRQRESKETVSDVFVMTISAFDGGVETPVWVKSGRSAGAKFGLFVMSCAIIAVCFICCKPALHSYGRIPASPTSTDRGKVTGYLGDFDLEDVELKHSATGGWHCNFVGKMALGEFTQRTAFRPKVNRNVSGELPDALMRSPLAEADNSKDMLFCDADYMDSSCNSHSSSGMLHGGEVNSEYGELVSAYNSSWSGRSRKRNEKAENKKTKAWGKDII